MLSLPLCIFCLQSPFPLSPVSMRFFKSQVKCCQPDEPFLTHSMFRWVSPLFLCPRRPLLTLLAQLPENVVPLFVSLLALPLSLCQVPGLWGRDWAFISLPYHSFSWYSNILTNYWRKLSSFHLSRLSNLLLKLGSKWEAGFKRQRVFSRFKPLVEIQTPALSYPILQLLRFRREVLDKHGMCHIFARLKRI